MLPKSRRLRLTRDFERVFAKGKALYGHYFKIRLNPSSRSLSRFAVVVSSKVHKRAVVRNRIRRRAWSVLANIHLLTPASSDIAIIALPPAASADFTEIAKEITQLLTKRSAHQ